MTTIGLSAVGGISCPKHDRDAELKRERELLRKQLDELEAKIDEQGLSNEVLADIRGNECEFEFTANGLQLAGPHDVELVEPTAASAEIDLVELAEQRQRAPSGERVTIISPPQDREPHDENEPCLSQRAAIEAQAEINAEDPMADYQSEAWAEKQRKKFFGKQAQRLVPHHLQ